MKSMVGIEGSSFSKSPCRILSDSFSILGGPLAEQCRPQQVLASSASALEGLGRCEEVPGRRISKAATDVIAEHFDEYCTAELQLGPRPSVREVSETFLIKLKAVSL